METAADPPSQFQKHTRACFRCKLIKTFEQVRRACVCERDNTFPLSKQIALGSPNLRAHSSSPPNPAHASYAAP
jgi:hypothetical protein